MDIPLISHTFSLVPPRLSFIFLTAFNVLVGWDFLAHEKGFHISRNLVRFLNDFH